jgi:hypothetical protein
VVSSGLFRLTDAAPSTARAGPRYPSSKPAASPAIRISPATPENREAGHKILEKSRKIIQNLYQPTIYSVGDRRACGAQRNRK